MGVGEQMKLYPDMPCNIVLIERSKEHPKVIQFQDIAPCHIYHFCYCSEISSSQSSRDDATDGGDNMAATIDKIEFNACCLPEGFTMYDREKQVWLANSNDAPGELWDYQLDLRSQTLTRQRTVQKEGCMFAGEFPTLHPFRHVIS